MKATDTTRTSAPVNTKSPCYISTVDTKFIDVHTQKANAENNAISTAGILLTIASVIISALVIIICVLLRKQYRSRQKHFESANNSPNIMESQPTAADDDGTVMNLFCATFPQDKSQGNFFSSNL